MLFAVMLWK